MSGGLLTINAGRQPFDKPRANGLIQNPLIFILLSVLFITSNAHANPLPPPVREALQQAHIPLGSIGVVVREVDGMTRCAQASGAGIPSQRLLPQSAGSAITSDLTSAVGSPSRMASSFTSNVSEAHTRKPLISINANAPMNPASTMKLLTTYAGLELLGPAYTWKTEAYLDGELKDGVLQGNLILKGYGDPKFTIEQFWLWLRELRARGLREIRGDLVLDRSFFDLPAYDPAAFDNDPIRAYNVGPDALLLNFNTLHLRYVPEGNGIKVIIEPSLEDATLDNRLVPQVVSHPSKENCDNWDDAIRIQADGDNIILQGDYPEECGEREQNISVMPHTRYAGALFHALWRELGGTLKGKFREGTVGGNARLFSTHRSPPLSEAIRDINKFSNNVMARQLFLTLGAADAATASIPRSIQAMQDWLTRKKLDFPELVIENGAGLSRNERISPLHLAQLLQNAAASPLSAELTASLPILGVDGSVKKRLKESPAASHAHLKTGTLEGVKTIAGYVQTNGGRQFIVVFLINHPNAAAGQSAQDALLEWVQRRY